ncbi:hypothetical protein ACWGHM_42400 [Streptomyces sp. NPDC054904]
MRNGKLGSLLVSSTVRILRAALSAAGITAMAVAELLSNGVTKQLVERRRPPKE